MMARLRVPERSPGSRILGVGVYRPTRVVGNDEICSLIDSSDEWIRRRSGIETRCVAGPDETVISMAVEAARKAMAQSGTQPDDVGMVLLATMSFLEQAPAAAPRVAHQLGARSAGSLDVAAACSGFCYALGLADSLVRSGDARNVVVIGSEKMSDIVDPTDRGTAFLFGDGAGAVVVGPSDTPGIGPVVWGSDGERHHMIAHDRSWLHTRETPGPWPTLRMAGPEVFRWASRVVPEISRQAVREAGLELSDLAAFVPHQANARIIDAAARSLDLAPHTVVARDVVTAGNTSAASIPLALGALLSRGSLSSGAPALLVGFGAGLAHAAQVVSLP
ncbi:beta-ketoacyl-ACP synthase III [Streptomyces sp. NPDC026659]|uniref:beta-ketoacyl-ACP synthase III n=1 Tax=Streptomyces sp. NPDC026659 TaxID=3155123 RepID=UPI0033FA2A4F